MINVAAWRSSNLWNTNLGEDIITVYLPPHEVRVSVLQFLDFLLLFIIIGPSCTGLWSMLCSMLPAIWKTVLICICFVSFSSVSRWKIPLILLDSYHIIIRTPFIGCLFNCRLHEGKDLFCSLLVVSIIDRRYGIATGLRHRTLNKYWPNRQVQFVMYP